MSKAWGPNIFHSSSFDIPHMYSFVSVPQSRVASRAATPADPQTVQEQVMDTIEHLDLFRMTQELVDRVAKGEVSAKDVHNEAGPIRSKITKVRQALAQLEDLNEGIATRQAKIDELQYRVSRKRDLLRQFQKVMGLDPEKLESDMKEEEIKRENAESDALKSVSVNDDDDSGATQEIALDIDAAPEPMDMTS